MKKLIVWFLFFLSASAYAGYSPFGWQGWLASVPTIADAPQSGNLVGSVVFAQDADELYYWSGSSWVELSGGGSGTVTSVSVVSANGFDGTVATATTTPAITFSTTVTGITKGNGTALSAAGYADVVGLFSGCSGTDYLGADGSCHSTSGSVYYQTDQSNGSSKPQEPVNNFSPNFSLTDNSGVATNIDLASTISSNTTGNAATCSNVAGLSDSEPVVTNSSGQVVSGSVSSPLTFAAGAFGCQTASGSQAGCLSSSDWTTFNNKSPAGNYATSGSGDVSWSAPSGPGAVTTSLVATSNSTLTTLSGLTTASNLVTVGTIGTGVWHGTKIGALYGGTGIDTSSSTGYPSISSGTWSVASVANTFITLFESVATTAGDLIYGGSSGTPTRLAIGSAGQTLAVNSGATAPAWSSNPVPAVVSLGTCTTSMSVDFSSGQQFTVTLTNGDTCAFTFSNVIGRTATIHIYQPSSGGGTGAASWSSVVWPNTTTPTITTGNSAFDKCTFVNDGIDTGGSCLQAF